MKLERHIRKLWAGQRAKIDEILTDIRIEQTLKEAIDMIHTLGYTEENIKLEDLDILQAKLEAIREYCQSKRTVYTHPEILYALEERERKDIKSNEEDI